jgi:hypothetical protein
MRELPARKRERFEALGLSHYDTLLLADDVATAEYFDAAIAAGAAPKPTANWILSDLSKHCNVRRPSASVMLRSQGYARCSIDGGRCVLEFASQLGNLKGCEAQHYAIMRADGMTQVPCMRWAFLM